MDCNSTSLPYEQIGFFSRIIVDYLKESDQLKPFYQHPASLDGLRESVAARKNFPTDRKKLVEVLGRQYALAGPSEKVMANIARLRDENTFTIVTAHQPNIFTGYLYFIYKILHVIRLADLLHKEIPGCSFVPVFYMGSEDADLDELGNISMNGEKIVWDTKQKGAVGRMKTKGLEKIISRIEGELAVWPFGNKLITLLKECYQGDTDVQSATFKLVHALFKEYGLVILLPDNADLKRSMFKIFEDDLLNQRPSTIVEETIGKLSAIYQVQANPREINLFYLRDDIRERIVKVGDSWKVVGHDIRFTEVELRQELQEHPERFSPNVILRGLYQETLLPNIAFIGGGGETAYWLELKALFTFYQVPFPVLILRNSFLFIDKDWQARIRKLHIDTPDLFKEERLLVQDLVNRDSTNQLQLSSEIAEATLFYDRVKAVAEQTDVTLSGHVEALKTRAVKLLSQLEKKMLKAETRKFQDQQRQIQTIKNKLFPQNGLQERVDNFMPYYAKYGPEFIKTLYEHSPALEKNFVVLTEK